jgi:hypothetical protein
MPPSIFLDPYPSKIVSYFTLKKLDVATRDCNIEVFRKFRYQSSITSSIFHLIEFDSTLFINLDA